MISIVVQFAIAPGPKAEGLRQAGRRLAPPAGRVPTLVDFPAWMEKSAWSFERVCVRD